MFIGIMTETTIKIPMLYYYICDKIDLEVQNFPFFDEFGVHLLKNILFSDQNYNI